MIKCQLTKNITVYFVQLLVFLFTSSFTQSTSPISEISRLYFYMFIKPGKLGVTNLRLVETPARQTPVWTVFAMRGVSNPEFGSSNFTLIFCTND